VVVAPIPEKPFGPIPPERFYSTATSSKNGKGRALRRPSPTTIEDSDEAPPPKKQGDRTVNFDDATNKFDRSKCVFVQLALSQLISMTFKDIHFHTGFPRISSSTSDRRS
jgi:hypothetical protein